jgi:3-oxoadipate enol-lactonase
MPVIHLNQNPVRYQVDGAAGLPWLVFSNSLGTDLCMWNAQAAFFSRDFRVLRYDTRGHGGTGAGVGTAAATTIEQLGHDVLALFDALDVERAHFCGLSMGGMIAQWLGIHAPQRLHKLVVANSAPRIGTAQGWHDRAALVRSTGMDAVADGAAARWFTPAFQQSAPQQVAALVAQLRATDANGYALCCEALATADLRDDVARIGGPTLLIAGAHDSVTTVAEAQALQGVIGGGNGATLVTLEASHISNIEAEEAFNRALADFLMPHLNRNQM